MADFQQNNEEKLQEQREVLEREYANKQADLALREQQIAEAEAKTAAVVPGEPPIIEKSSRYVSRVMVSLHSCSSKEGFGTPTRTVNL